MKNHKRSFLIAAIMFFCITVFVTSNILVNRPNETCNDFNNGINDLNRLNLRGDVSKVEIITQTTIPISEWLYTNINTIDFSRRCRANAVYSFMGNSEISFDEQGNLKSQILYDNEGEILYDGDIGIPEKGMLTLYNPINIKVNELFATWDYDKDDSGRIIEQRTTDDDEVCLTRQVLYNKEGDIDMVICQYDKLKLDFATDSYLPKDTTFFRYIERDSIGNWTLAEVFHNGRMNTDKYKVYVRRQFTYRGDTPKPALVEQLSSWNLIGHNNDVQPKGVTLTPKTLFNGEIGLSIPSGMVLNNLSQASNRLLYQLNGIEGYFCIIVCKVAQKQNIFENEPSGDLYKALTYSFAQQGDIVLKWYNYSNKEKINGNRFVAMKYAVYASGGYTQTGDPVIVEALYFQPLNSGILYSITIGYDSYHQSKYKPWAEKIKKTIHIQQLPNK